MDTKSGFKTTEFWVTLLQALVGPVVMVLVAVGIFSADMNQEVVTDELVTNIQTLATTAAAMVAVWTSASATKKYTESRATVKAAKV